MQEQLGASSAQHKCISYPPWKLTAVSQTWGRNIELDTFSIYQTLSCIKVKFYFSYLKNKDKHIHILFSPPIQLLKRFNKFTWVCCQENGNLTIFFPDEAAGLPMPLQRHLHIHSLLYIVSTRLIFAAKSHQGQGGENPSPCSQWTFYDPWASCWMLCVQSGVSIDRPKLSLLLPLWVKAT